MVSIEARSMTENKCWEGLDRISEKLLTCGLKENIMAARFRRFRARKSSMENSYGHFDFFCPNMIIR
jgi:hypothetical protein